METVRPPSEESAPTRREQLRELSDEELMEQLQAGVVEALDILVDRYSERLSNYLYGFVGDEQKVSDLLQETFIRVFRNRHSYERIAKFSTWLYTIAGNLARTEYRKSKRDPTTSIYRTSRDNEEYEMQLPDGQRHPDRLADQPIYREEVQKALEQLDEPFREAVILRDKQQLSYKEIAEITGAPIGTVKSRIHRGRERLQELLDEVYPFQSGG
jgi:RNA polymerase sigma-70 factor (ECF subfamily)